MDDPVTKLVVRLLAAEDLGEIESLAAEVQAAIRVHIDKIRNQLIVLPAVRTAGPSSLQLGESRGVERKGGPQQAGPAE